MLARRKIGTGAAIATGVILAAVLTGSASAGTPGGCSNAASGANGQTCTNVGSHLYPGISAGLHLTVPPVTGTPSCPDATASLVQARLVVGGANGRGGTSQRLAEATKADAIAHDELSAAITADTAEDADTTPDTEDIAVTKAAQGVTDAQTKLGTDQAKLTTDQAKLTTDQATLTAAQALPTTDPTRTAKVADAQGAVDTDTTAISADQGWITGDKAKLADAKATLKAAQQADAKEDGNGVKEDPQDPADAKLAAARNKANAADRRLADAENAEGVAEQGIVDAEVVIGQACKTPVVIPPAPPADSPAPQPPVITGGNPGPITIINGQAPAPQIVQGNLPVTG